MPLSCTCAVHVHLTSPHLTRKIYEKYKIKRAELELEFAGEYGKVYERRAEVVAGRARGGDGEHDTTWRGMAWRGMAWRDTT